MGPAWECPPERLANGRIIFRCAYGHFHSYAGAAWSCGGPDDHGSTELARAERCRDCGRDDGGCDRLAPEPTDL